MGALDDLRGQIVGMDTAPLIYFIEKHPVYLQHIRPFLVAAESGAFEVITSTLTLSEVLVLPYRRADYALVQRYSRILLHARHLRVLPVSSEIAEAAAQLRSRTGLKTPDAIQVATAEISGATALLTNDRAMAAATRLRPIVLHDLLTQPSGV